MATKFTMIAPFDQASGNVSGKQALKYALNNNPAYEAPVGQKNYARNYRTRYIAGIRSATGEGYIQVRKKNAVNLTQRAKLNMALLGGTGAMYANIINNKSSEVYTGLLAQYTELQNYGLKKTFRQYVCDNLRAGLIAKQAQIPFAGPRPVVQVTNPWNYSNSTPNVTVSSDVLVKFWLELASNGITFTVAGMKGVAIVDEDFDDVTASNHNVLNLSLDENEKVKCGNAYLLNASNEYVEGGDVVTNGASFTLTETAPA